MISAIPSSSRLLTVIAAVFAVTVTGSSSRHSASTAISMPVHRPSTTVSETARTAADRKRIVRRTVRKLAGPYAHLVLTAALKAHVPPRLVAAVVQVENGGNFHGSTTRVSSAGAIGVMQLEPNTAWSLLRVNPWNARQNIDGGARYLAMMLRMFNGDAKLALMAYNAGPTSIANGVRPRAALAYANAVMRDAGEARHA